MDNLTKKTTILFPPHLHRRLTRLADQRGTSLGELVHRACEKQYGIGGSEERIWAVRAIGALELPVGCAGSDETRVAAAYPHLMARDGLHAAVVLQHQLDGLCSFDTDFDPVAGVERVEP